MSVSHGSDILFYIAIGDNRQLPALTLVAHILKRAEIRVSFIDERLGASLFQRMTENKRCALLRLTSQFGMNSAISNFTSAPFYGHIFDSPLGDDKFLSAYNRVHFRADQHGFATLTFINTSTYLDRHEKEGGRRAIKNDIEARVITLISG